MPGGLPHEDSLDRLLRQSLGSGLPPGSTSCVEPETLAAWADGGLSAAERRDVEAHLSACPTCREVVAAFARSAPVAPVILRFWTQKRRAYVVTTAAAAAGIAMWFAVSTPTVPPVPMTVTARLEQPAVPPPVSNPPPESGSRAKQETPAPPGDAARASPDSARATSMADNRAIRATPPPAQPVQPADRAREAADRFVDAGLPPAAAPPPLRVFGGGGVVGGIAPPAPPSPAATAPGRNAIIAGVSASPPTPQAQSVERSVQNTPVIELVPPSALLEQVATTLVDGTIRQGVAAGRGGTAPAPAVAALRQPPIRWRVFPDGHVERSLDEGQSWVRMALGTDVPAIVGGAAPLSTVCWLIGPQGTVLRTLNGGQFQRRPFPEAVDLISISAASAEQATVTDARRRVFTTTDGGATWRLSGG
ncbi:MAG: zf-HC2 domain-containing protein [Vicinamibacterales bacterium]